MDAISLPILCAKSLGTECVCCSNSVRFICTRGTKDTRIYLTYYCYSHAQRNGQFVLIEIYFAFFFSFSIEFKIEIFVACSYSDFYTKKFLLKNYLHEEIDSFFKKILVQNVTSLLTFTRVFCINIINKIKLYVYL